MTTLVQTDKVLLRDTAAKKCGALLPLGAELSLIQVDGSDVTQGGDTLQLEKPPRPGRPRVLEHPRNLVPLKDSDEPQGWSHAAISFGDRHTHVLGRMTKLGRPRVIS